MRANVLQMLRQGKMDKKQFLSTIHAKLKSPTDENKMFNLFIDFLSIPTAEAAQLAYHARHVSQNREPALFDYISHLDRLGDSAIPQMILGKSQEMCLPPRILQNFRKGYENFHIARFITNIAKNSEFTEVVDVGSGKGCLSQTFACMRPLLHSIGVDRRVRRSSTVTDSHLTDFLNYSQFHCTYPADKSPSPHLIRMRIPHKKFKDLLLKPYRFSVGLHSCGNLAIDHLLSAGSANACGALSIGCCYHLLSTKNRTAASHSHPLMQSVLTLRDALHIANLRHDMPRSDVLAKSLYRKRLHRYAVETLSSQSDEWRRRLVTSKGPHKAAVLKGTTFAEYVEQWMQQGGAHNTQTTDKLSKSDIYFLTDFFRSPETQELVNVAAKFRGFQCRLLGKPLESLIHLDRALLMHEKFGADYNISVRKLFPAHVSTRNIGILLLRKKSLLPKLLV
ncbi:Methyltransferase domain containing protein [Perkinsela sp. CCAP 1560/4]|nr:Methyltransferase domain containing protein [Perkinsela sp. CCAP 1560/4]|eukprot:KNH08880.1 Methyltransferase domain containing protein [Perkinsela sp. CCAP 1560/4]